LALVAPLAAAGWHRLGEQAGGQARWIVAPTVVAAACLAIVGLRALEEGQDVSTTVAATVDGLRREVGGGSPAPLLATTGGIARFSWEHLDEGAWHTVSAASLPRYSARLAALGEPIVLFTRDPEADLPVVEADWIVEPIAGRTVYRLTPR
jgi:hypothetical protein